MAKCRWKINANLSVSALEEESRTIASYYSTEGVPKPFATSTKKAFSSGEREKFQSIIGVKSS